MKNTKVKGGINMGKQSKLAMLALGAVMSLGGCGRDNYGSSQLDPYQKAEQRSSEYLGDKINLKVVYQQPNGRMSYDSFIKVTDIDRKLPDEFNETPVWVVVNPSLFGAETKQELVSGEGIRFEIPLSIATEVLARVSK